MKNLKKLLSMILVLAMLLADFGLAQEMLVADMGDLIAMEEMLADSGLELTGEVIEEDGELKFVVEQAETEETFVEEAAPVEETAEEELLIEEIPMEELPVEEEAAEEGAEIPGEVVPEEEPTEEEVPAEEPAEEEEIIGEIVVDQMFAAPTYCEGCGQYNTFTAPPVYNDDYHWYVCQNCYYSSEDEMHYSSCTEGDIDDCDVCGANVYEGIILNVTHEPDGETRVNDEEHWDVCKLCNLAYNEESHWVWCTDENPDACEGCGYKYASGYELRHKDLDYDKPFASEYGHGYLCADCGEIGSDLEEHEALCWEDPDHCAVCGWEVDDDYYRVHTVGDAVISDTHHTWYCEGCGLQTNSEEHFTFCDSADKTTCVECGAEDVTCEIHHDFDNGTMHSDADYHWFECAVCGEEDIKWEHDAICTDPNHCAACGYYSKNGFDFTGHEYDRSNFVEITDKFHTVGCMFCGDEMSIAHWVNCSTPDSKVCVDCGTKCEYPEIWHGDSEIQVFEKYHQEVCTECGEVTYTNRHWASCDNPTVCWMCGYDKVEPDPEHMTHDWVYTKKDSKTHIESCSKCDYKVEYSHWASCDKPGKCYGCGYKGTVPLSHYTYDPQWNADEHWFSCYRCNETKVHKGIHWANCFVPDKCAECGAPASEVNLILEHEFDANGECVFCDAVRQGIASIILPEKVTLGVGEKETLTLKIEPAGAEGTISYTLSSKNATFNKETLVVTAKKASTVELTATADSGATATTVIEILKAPSKVTLSNSKLTLGEGDSYALSATLSANSASKLTWSSSDEDIVAVDENGVLTAIGAGKATITVKTFNKKSAKCTVTVAEGPDTIEADLPEAMSVGQTIDLKLVLKNGATVINSTNTTFRCEQESAVEIDGTSIKLMQEGEVKIIATAYNGYEETITLNVQPAPDKLYLNERGIIESGITLGVGEKMNFTPIVANGSVFDVEFISNNEAAATVSGDAAGFTVTGKKAGESATITVQPHLGRAATIHVTVEKAPSKVVLSAKKLTLGEGESMKLNADFPADSYSNLTWKSSKPGVVTVDENGMLTAVAEKGSSTITATTFNKKKATCTVTVKKAPETVTLTSSLEDGIFSVGQTADLKVALSKGSAGSYWFDVDPASTGMVAFDGNTVIAEQAGEVKIIATAYNGVSGELNLTVQPAPDQAVLDAEGAIEKEITLGVGEKLTLKPAILNGSKADFSYEIVEGSTKTATVSAAGAVAAKKAGEVIIAVKPHMGEAATLKVKVVAAPKSVSLSAKTMTLGEGETAQLVATLKNEGSFSNLTWKSSKPGVVAVDENGNLKALKAGKSTITVNTFNKKKATCTVTVLAEPTAMELTVPTDVISMGQTLKLAPVFEPAKCANNVNYTLSAEGIIELDGGVVTPVQPGKVTITASTYNGLSDSVTIKVMDYPDYLVVAEEIELGVGEKLELKPAAANGSPVTLKYKAKSTKVATVSADGLVTGKKAGSTTITITPHAGEAVIVDVVVKAAPKSVTLSDAELKMNIGEEYQLTAALPNKTASKITWSSNNEEVAKVEADGTVIATGEGTAVITAKTFNGKTAKCAVAVEGLPQAQNFAAVYSGEGIVEFSWDAVENADGYQLLVLENGAWKELQEVAGTSAVVEGLEDGIYQFAVRAFMFKNDKTVPGKNAVKEVVVADPLEIIDLYASEYFVQPDTEVCWTVEVAGGLEPYDFHYDLYLNGEHIHCAEQQKSNEFEWTLEKEGEYTLAATVTDILGNTQKWNSDFSVNVTLGNFWGYEEDGGFVIEGGDNIFGNVKIPDMVNGMPVVGISDGAFRGRGDITSVVIPDSVTRIGWGAFQDSAIESVTLPASLEEIGGGAFANTFLTEAEIPEGTAVVHEAAFADNADLELVTIPASVTEFGPDVFANDNRVKLKVAAGSAAEDYAKEYGICYDNGNGYSLHIFGVDYNGEAYGVGETGSWSVEAFGGSGNYKFGFILERNGEAIVETDWIDDCEFAYTFETSGKYMLQAWVNDGESIYHRGCDYAVVISSYDDSGFRYADRGDGNLMLTGVNPEAVDENGVVTLPAEIGGIPVINVAEGAFGGCDYINTLIIPEGYEVIESAAFVNSSVESVQLPGTLKRIEDYAFGNADGLEYISVPDSVDYLGQSAFEGCDVLETVVIPASLGEIRNWTFAGCESLVTVEYRYNNDSERITVIGDAAFEDCRSLVNVGISDAETIGNSAFRGCCSLDDVTLAAAKVIGANAFECCCSMSYLVFGDQLTEMGSHAFQNCHSLSEITIPGSVKRISEWVFDNCGTMELTLEEGVETIADGAFINNHNLRVLNLPSSLKFIGNWAFESSGNLREVDFTKVTAEFGDGAFNNSGVTMIVAKDTEAYNYAVNNDIRRIVVGEANSDGLIFELVWNEYSEEPEGAKLVGYDWEAGELEGTLVIPESVNFDGVDYPVIRVEESAITDTWNLNEVVLPDTIKTLGQWAFANNRGLRKVNLPEGLEEIEWDVFNGCESLEEATVPASCGFLGGGAFANCVNLKKLTILSRDADFDDGHLVDGSEKLVIYCYAGSTAEQFCKGEWGEEGYPEFVPYTLIDGDVEFYGVMDIEVYKYAGSIGDNAIWSVYAVGQEGNREFHYSLNRNDEHYWASGWTTSERMGFVFEEDGDYQMTVSMRIAGDEDSETEYFFDDDILTVGQYAEGSPFRYMFEDEGVRICSYDDDMPEHLDIPAELEVEVDGEIVALPVVSIGAYAFCDQWNLRSVSIPETVETIMAGAFCRTSLESVEIPDTVRELGYEAFAECGDLASVKLGSGLMEVPMRAFADCHGLESVSLSEGLEFIGENAFECCCSLHEIKLPETLKAIGGRAFARCGLNSLAIPDSVVEIQWEAFHENHELETVELGSGLRGLQACAFMDCGNLRSINLEDTQLVMLGGSVFENCHNLQSIVIPDTVVEMGHRVFLNCHSLESAVLGSGITNTMYATFEECHSLRSVTLPANLEVIDNWCFKNCYSLPAIEIPESVHTLGDNAFESCHNMDGLYIPESVENFGEDVFCNNGSELFVKIDSNAHYYVMDWGYNYVPVGEADQGPLCYEVTEEGIEITGYDGGVEGDLIIPDEIDGMPVVSIGWNAFDGQNRMTSIAIPGSIYNIGGYAFQGCANIRSLDLPESLESIEEAAFNDCRKLTVVEIPDGVEYIGYNAFANCERLEEVHIPASVTQFEDRLIEGSRRCVLFVQPGSDAEAYAIENNLPYNNGTVAPFMVMEVRVDKWTDVVGDNAEWSAFVVGGESGMKYNYRLYKNGEMFKDFGWKAESTLSYEFTEDGDYTMELAVRKASGKVSDYTMGHETIIIGVEDEEGLFRYSYVGENEIKITSVTNCEGAFEVPETINGATVVGIAENCFNGRGELESITLPSTLRFIDAQAFTNCYFLYDVNFGEGSNLEEIGEYAFFECHSLSNVELPSKVEEIGMGVFENCYSLESVKLPAGITEISECAFRADGCLTEISLPAGLKVIKSNAFAYTSLEEINLPESLEWIEDQVFAETPLKSIVIPDKVECIGYEAFVRCGDLEEVQLGSGLRALMSCAFMDCHSLQSINLEDTQLELLGGGVFECCCSLKSVVIPDTVVEMGHRVFFNCISLESAVMGNGMTETMWATFEDCPSLQTVTLPKNVEDIGNWCFKNCHSLNNLAIPASLKSIGEFAFEGAFNLGELTLPDDFDGFGEGCFDDSGVILLVKLDTPAYHYAQEWGLNYRLEGMEVDTSPLVFELWEGEVEGNYFAVLCGYDGEPIGDLVIPSTYEQDGETFTVAGINSGALVDGTNLMSVTIPATVQFIGDSAFANCWRMHTVNFEEGSKLEEIGAEAFANCKQLSSINLEACDNLEIIYDRVFADCYSLGNLAIPASVKEIGGDLVDNNPYTILHVTRGSVGEEYAIENGYAYDNGSGVALTVQELVVEQHAGIGETAVWSTRWVGGSGSVSFTYNLYLGGEAYKKPLVKDSEEDWVEFEFTENGVYMMEVVAKDNKTGKTFSKFANEEVIVSDYDEASGFTYAIEDAEEKNLVITGCGDELGGDVVIPSKLTIDGTAYNVVAILGGAFAGRGSIESVVVSEGIERIDNECFADMFGLRSVELPSTLGEIRPHTFANCINLESVTIANGPESIGESAFDRCGSLTEIKLPESLKVIEGWAFKDCDLKSVVIPDGVEEILWDAFYANKNLETVQLGTGLRVLQACVFMECESLREINLQDTSLEMLGGSVFENCFSLKSIVMPDSIGEMGHRVFFNCSSLESAVMSNGLTNAMWATFENCVKLQSVTLPENLEVIGQWCFNNCSSLESLAVPASVCNIEGTPEEGFAFYGVAEGFKLIVEAGSYAQEYAVEFGIPCEFELEVSAEFDYSLNADQSGVVIQAYKGSEASVVVPETLSGLPVTEIGDGAFEDNASLTTIDLPDSVEVIGVRAFANCTRLSSMI